jgi:hypothetical protein
MCEVEPHVVRFLPIGAHAEAIPSLNGTLAEFQPGVVPPETAARIVGRFSDGPQVELALRSRPLVVGVASP